MKGFRSFQNVPLVGQAEAPPTKEEMAADLALEMIEKIKAQRAEALRREENAEEPLRETPELREAYQTLEALMKGPHRWVVVPVILEHLPEVATPPTDAEKAAVEQHLRANHGICQNPKCGHNVDQHRLDTKDGKGEMCQQCDCRRFEGTYTGLTVKGFPSDPRNVAKVGE